MSWLYLNFSDNWCNNETDFWLYLYNQIGLFFSLNYIIRSSWWSLALIFVLGSLYLSLNKLVHLELSLLSNETFTCLEFHTYILLLVISTPVFTYPTTLTAFILCIFHSLCSCNPCSLIWMPSGWNTILNYNIFTRLLKQQKVRSSKSISP